VHLFDQPFHNVDTQNPNTLMLDQHSARHFEELGLQIGKISSKIRMLIFDHSP
jgi:hypothetical protein